MVAIFVCPYSWSLFVGATSSSERQEVFRMQQSGRVHPGPVGLAHEVQLLPQLECSRQMQPPPAPLPHEQLMSGLLLVLQNSQWDPHASEVRTKSEHFIWLYFASRVSLGGRHRHFSALEAADSGPRFS